MLNIKFLTDELMLGHMEIIEDIEEIMIELNLQELMLNNNHLIHRLEIEKNDNYFWVADVENTFELGLELFCQINCKIQMDIDDAYEYIEQCEELHRDYTTYKRALATFKIELKTTTDKILIGYFNDFIRKYEIQLGMIEDKMYNLGLKLSDLCKELQKEIDYDKFIDVFGLNECTDKNCYDNEVVREEGFYNNLMFNRGAVGRVVRTGLIYGEKTIRDVS
ncbi:MAG: hypothetical protein ACI8WT_001794 [Clostridium sp.]|jgi:hypothetical protein